MKNRYKIGLGLFVLAGIIIAATLLLGSIVLMEQVGNQSVVNDNRTLERYAKKQMVSILSLSNQLLKDNENLSAQQQQQITQIGDAAAQYIRELQTRTESDYSTLEEIKANH